MVVDMIARMIARMVACSVEAKVATIGTVAGDTKVVAWAHCHIPS